ncbi:hypothetical protein BGX38DRAFT_1171156 [Terfezia claveryi]|nr:hypothetical protein BGX38DRAFT_1171156 [Terfezia claveryi]
MHCTFSCVVGFSLQAFAEDACPTRDKPMPARLIKATTYTYVVWAHRPPNFSKRSQARHLHR